MHMKGFRLYCVLTEEIESCLEEVHPNVRVAGTASRTFMVGPYSADEIASTRIIFCSKKNQSNDQLSGENMAVSGSHLRPPRMPFKAGRPDALFLAICASIAAVCIASSGSSSPASSSSSMTWMGA